MIRDGYLIDRKYGDRLKLPERALEYDAERNRVDAMPPRAFEDLLNARRPEVRHWLQMLGDGWLRSALLVLMPRLKYLFGDP